MADEEEWKLLEDSDQIIYNHPDGYLAYYGAGRGGNYGCVLRQQDGVWQKRMSRFPILNPLDTLGAPISGKAYKEGTRPQKSAPSHANPMPFLKKMGIVS